MTTPSDDGGDESTTPSCDEPKTLSDDVSRTPSGEKSTRPSGDESPTPGGEEPTSPSCTKSAMPSGDESTTPSGDESSTPSGDEPTSPSGDMSTAPGGDKSTTPIGDEATTPTRNEPTTPSGGESTTPSDDEPTTPTRKRRSRKRSDWNGVSMSRRGGHRPRGATRGRFAHVISQDQKDTGGCFVCTCAHPLANSGAAKTGDIGAPEGEATFHRERNLAPRDRMARGASSGSETDGRRSGGWPRVLWLVGADVEIEERGSGIRPERRTPCTATRSVRARQGRRR